jgi:hypothetical protein
MDKILCFLSAGIMVLTMFDLFRTKKIPDDIVYQSTSAEGTAESIHIGGRTEIVKVIGATLTRGGRHSSTTSWGRKTDLWRLDSDIIQPEGERGFLAPHLEGKVDVKQKAGQLTEFGENPWDTLNDMIGGWSTFRFAYIAFKDGKPVSVHFSHLKFVDNNWVSVAKYIAYF